MADKPARLGDLVTVDRVQNGQPGECIVRCRAVEGCPWQAHSLTPRLAAELAHGHLWDGHGIKIDRQPPPKPSRAAVAPNPHAATIRRMAGPA